MGVKRGRVSIGVLIVAGILIAASILAFYILTQKAQPDIEEVAAQNVDHYAVYKVTLSAGQVQKTATLVEARQDGKSMMYAKSDQGETKLVILGDKAYYCRAPPGAQWRCTEISVVQAARYSLKTIVFKMENVTPLQPKTIGGQYSYCWGGSLPPQGAASAKVAICMTPNGVVTRLVTETRVSGRLVQRTEMVLTSLKWTVPPDAFKLPAEPGSP